MDWAQHRRRKAAAKTHMRLNLQSLLPNFVIIDTAGEHDNKRARELCAGVKSGEIVLFDKEYVDFGHLRDLDERGVSWVTRAKDNMAYDAVRKIPRSKDEKILRDELIVLSNPNKSAPELMRRIVALVEIDGKEREMVFLTNNLETGQFLILAYQGDVGQSPDHGPQAQSGISRCGLPRDESGRSRRNEAGNRSSAASPV
jgi:Transposase DDE domain